MPTRLPALFVLLASAVATPLWAVEGRVWIDANGNGTIDSWERLVADCLVSDGRQIVRTDAEGHYELPSGAEPSTVFVINPPGTWPSGRWWATVAANAAADVNFALRDQRQDGPLIFIHGTDIHLRPEAVESYRRYVASVNAFPLPVQFVLHTGDLVVDSLAVEPDKAEKLYQLYEDETRAIKYPLREVIGNHEHVATSRKDAQRGPDHDKGMYRRRLGPPSYAFRYGAYHFVALDGTTIDHEAKKGYHDRLDEASLAWATSYLANVGPDDHLVLMVHQPLTTQDTSAKLAEAVAGKNLVVTLCGHGHGRGVTTWAGAPMIMGGAVSYAWHGFQPFPPDPWGYVVYRLDRGLMEYAFRDWAVPRSFDVKSPATGAVATGKTLTLDATLDDPDGRVRSVACRLGAVAADVQVIRAGQLNKRIQGTIDAAALPDGVHDLTFEARDERETVRHSRPIVVRNGQASAALPGKGTLRLHLAHNIEAGTQVLLNGELLGTLPAAGAAAKEFKFELPEGRLRRLNDVTIVPGPNATLEATRIMIDYAGHTFCDVRFAPTLRRTLAKSGNPGKIVNYIDVTYTGPRGMP